MTKEKKEKFDALYAQELAAYEFKRSYRDSVDDYVSAYGDDEGAKDYLRTLSAETAFHGRRVLRLIRIMRRIDARAA
jgi:hypothetical protein